MGIGIWQIVAILVVLFLLFGAGKLPRLMGDVAEGINAFKKGLKDDDGKASEVQEDVKQVSSDADIDVKAEVVEDNIEDKKAS